MKNFEYFKKKGLQWNLDMLLLSHIILTFFYIDTDYTEDLDSSISDILSHGARFEKFRANSEISRKTLTYLTYIQNEYSNGSLDASEEALYKKLLMSGFSIQQYVGYIRKMKSTSFNDGTISTLLKKLINQSGTSNARLKALGLSLTKFKNLSASQQVEFVYRLRNYVTTELRGVSQYPNVLNRVYKDYVTFYNVDKSDFNDEERVLGLTSDQWAKGLAAAATLYGVKKAGNLLKGLANKKRDNWASRIAGKAEHRSFDDHTRVK